VVFWKRILSFSFCLILALNAASVFSNGNKEVSQKPILAVSILPQSYFVERISGGDVKPLVLVGAGQDPHTYEPTPRQMADLSKASAWILSGTNFEIALLPKIKNLYPNLKMMDGTEGVTFRQLEAHEDHETENHQLDKMENDPHTWLGKEPAKILAAHVLTTLKNILPENAETYQQNYETLINDIDAEFNRLDTALAPLRGRSVFVYHPSFGYFFDEFGIMQEAVESGGKEPGPRQITELITQAKTEHVTVIFVQAEFPAETAKTIAAALGVNVFPMNALAEDWLSNIRFMGDSLLQGTQK
jgi:zinc transport system substrate-binding protein